MKTLSTKKKIVLTTYTQKELEDKIDTYVYKYDFSGLMLFLNDVKSFNPESLDYIEEDDAVKLITITRKKTKKNPQELYKNYYGTPFGLNIFEVELHYSDAVSSLKSAFKNKELNFNFKKDYFHISRN